MSNIKSTAYFVCIALIILMAVFLISCTNVLKPEDTPAATTPEATTSAENLSDPPVESMIESSLDISEIEALIPAYESLMYAMREMPEGGSNYNAFDPYFFWNTAYYMLVNHGHNDLRATIDGAQLIVPMDMFNEYMSACFGDYLGPVNMPADYEGITYDSETNSYIMGLSDSGEDFMKVLNVAAGADGNYDVMVGWFAPDENYDLVLLSAYSFVVANNNYASAIEGAAFNKSVWYMYNHYTNAVVVTNVYSDGEGVFAKLEAIKTELVSGENAAAKWTIVKLDEAPVTVEVYPNAEFGFSGFELLNDIDEEQMQRDSFAFFVDHAGKLMDNGEHAPFYVNIYDGMLFGGAFAQNIYFSN